MNHKTLQRLQSKVGAPEHAHRKEWAARAPIGAGIAFCDLVIEEYNGGHGPLAFLFETILSCAGDDELDRLNAGLVDLTHMIAREQDRRVLHGVRPREAQKRRTKATGAKIIPIRSA